MAHFSQGTTAPLKK